MNECACAVREGKGEREGGGISYRIGWYDCQDRVTVVDCVPRRCRWMEGHFEMVSAKFSRVVAQAQAQAEGRATVPRA